MGGPGTKCEGGPPVRNLLLQLATLSFCFVSGVLGVHVLFYCFRLDGRTFTYKKQELEAFFLFFSPFARGQYPYAGVNEPIHHVRCWPLFVSKGVDKLTMGER